MNKWRLLLLAVFCIFQPISTENLFNGRERCLQQRPDSCRKDSRLLEFQSDARPEIRRVNRNSREFLERVNAENALRFSERDLNNRDENIRPENRRSRSNDRIRVSLTSRQRIPENVYEERLERRSLRNERSEPELRSVQEERRLITERHVRNTRITRSLTRESRQSNEREDTVRYTISRDTQLVNAPNGRIVEQHFDNIQHRLIRSRQGRYLNKRRESRSTSRASHVPEDIRANSEVVYDRFIRTDDSSRLNNERLQREFQGNVKPDNRQRKDRPESVFRATFNNEIIRQRTQATRRRVTEQRGVQRTESDEFRDFRRELRESPNEASVRFEDSRRQINERLTRGQINVHASRRNNIRLELARTDNEDINRKTSPTTVNTMFERRESAQRRETDVSRQLRRELRAYSDRAYERESIHRRASEEYRDLRRELWDSADKANGRYYIRLDDSMRRTQERENVRAQRNIGPESIRTHNSEFNRRSSSVTTRYETEERNAPGEHYNSRRETRNPDVTDSRFDSRTSRNIRRETRQKSKIDVSRIYNVEISGRSSPVSMRYVGDRTEYMHRRDLDTSRVASSGNRRNSPNSVRNISDKKEFVERSDDTRYIRINERLQSQNRGERRNIWSQSERTSNDETKRSFAAVIRDAIKTREFRQRYNLDESRNFGREIRDIRFDVSNGETLNTRVQRDVIQSRHIKDSYIRTLNAKFRQDNKRVDENRRTARVTIRDSRVAEVVRDENEASRYKIREKEMTKERSRDKPVSMLIRRKLETRIKRDTSSRTRINNSNTLKDTFDQIMRAVSQNNRDVERNVERRGNRETPQDYRFESRHLKNTFERSMAEDSGKRLLDDSIGNRRGIRLNALFSRDNRNSAKNGKDSKNLREQIRVSMAPHDVPSEETSDLSFTWQHLLYLLQAAYIVGLLAKLSQAKNNSEKKTRIGIWNHSPKLIKVD